MITFSLQREGAQIHQEICRFRHYACNCHQKSACHPGHSVQVGVPQTHLLYSFSSKTNTMMLHVPEWQSSRFYSRQLCKNKQTKKQFGTMQVSLFLITTFLTEQFICRFLILVGKKKNSTDVIFLKTKTFSPSVIALI